jgi:membrane-bound lytic murein transglycosylase D
LHYFADKLEGIEKELFKGEHIMKAFYASIIGIMALPLCIIAVEYVKTRNQMRMHACRYVALIFLFLSFSCSAHRFQKLQQPGGLSETRPPAVGQASQQPEEITLPIDGIEDAVEGENRESAAAFNEINSDAPSQDYSQTLPESSPAEEHIKNRALALAENADASESGEDVENTQKLLDSALDLINSSQESWTEGDQDQALTTLDEAYGMLIQVNTDENSGLYQQKEDLRYMISKRILEIYASRYTATNGNYNEIPMTLNEYVKREIKSFQGPERKSFTESYRRSGRYMPMIRKELKEAGLPQDIAWLPLIESGFKVNALSSARALGLWQFIASTGQKYGLKRDTWIDERLDPEKATAAAIAYLKELHQIFGDWTTVLAGYNCGEVTVLKKIRDQKINYLDNFWDLFQLLPYETARYVPRFLATLHILEDPTQYGFEFDEPESPVAYEAVTVKKPIQLRAVADTIGVSEEELCALNPELRYKATPPTAYSLKIPEGKANILLARINDLPDWIPPRNAYVIHRVRKGETLSDIALHYRTSVSGIVRANNIREKDFIRVGQKLKVPPRGTTSGSSSIVHETLLEPGRKYRVQEGDSLWLIAKKYNTNTKKIQHINNLTDTRLHVGQILTIP